MNYFFYIVGAFSLVLLADDVSRVIAWCKHGRTATSWGALHRGVSFLWFITFAISSVGLACSFYLYSQGKFLVLPTLLFVAMNVMLVLMNHAIDHQERGVVAFGLPLLVMIYTLLFGCTIYLYPIGGTSEIPTSLLVTTHFCNGVGILHSSVLDSLWWQRGWLDKLQLDREQEFEGGGDVRVW
jgi:hypothetical protein